MEVLSVNIASPSAPIIGTTVVLLVGATVTDLRARRIPNFLTFPAVGAGVVLHSVQEGWWGLALSLAGALMAPGVLMLLRAFRRLGMGDVKLAMAVGALLGPAAGALAMLSSCIAGGFLAFACMLRPGSAGARYISPFFIGVPVLSRVYSASTEPSSETPIATLTIPYGVAIAVGTLLTVGALQWT
jgi:prepilin peptidase CpaA